MITINHVTQVIRMPNKCGTPSNLKSFTGKWRNGATKTIRVPVVLAEQIEAYAREIDSGIESRDTSDSSQAAVADKVMVELLEIKAKIEAKESGYKANSASKLVSALKAVFDSLEGET